MTEKEKKEKPPKKDYESETEMAEDTRWMGKGNPVKKATEALNKMREELEKGMKGPESPGVKKPDKIPLSANKQAITEEPATRSSTSQNYKNTPDMNKSDESVGGRMGIKEYHSHDNNDKVPKAVRDMKGKKEPITKSDEAALKKAISDTTTIVKAMSLIMR